MARDLEAVIRISGNLDDSLRRAIEQAADRIEQLNDAARQSADAVDALSDTIDAQGDALKQAKKQYAAYVLNGEKGTQQAKELAKKIRELSGDLSNNRTALRAAEQAADQLDRSLDDVGDAAKDAGDGFSVMKGAAADLVSSGIQKVIEVCTGAVSSIYGLAESTREFRQDMGTLETAFDRANFTAEQAGDTWIGLYSIFGEDDRAVEAANNIARMADNQKDLDKWVTITTGAWGTFQDSLPVESLAEAAGETAKTGQVVGTLADALNWNSDAAKMFAEYMSEDVVTAEDAFNVALSKCTTEAERQSLVTDTLLALYGDAAKTYETTAESVMEANAANAEFLQTQAEIGERIEPVTTAVRRGVSRILSKVLELTEGVDFDAMADRVSNAFEVLSTEVLPMIVEVKDELVELADKGISWVKDNAEWLVPVLGGLVGGFAAYKVIMLASAAASKAMAIAEGIKTAVLATGTTTVSAATVATWALNSAIAFLTSPVTIAVAAIAALTAGTIWLYRNWDTAKEKLLEFGERVQEIWSGISSWITGAIDTIGQHFPVFGGFLSGWWTSIQDAVGNVKAIFGGLIGFISNVFAGNWSDAWNSVVDIFFNIFGMLGNLAKAPLNGVISAANAVINGINGMGFTIPEWVPVVGGKSFALDIPNIPMLATGGFTDGPSIAGEAGMEAVISFDRSVREANLGYWAKAGRMLGATADDAGFSLSGASGGDTVIDMGGVTFAPNISISGKADKESVIKAIEDEYPEFLDMLERWLYERGLPVYG